MASRLVPLLLLLLLLAGCATTHPTAPAPHPAAPLAVPAVPATPTSPRPVTPTTPAPTPPAPPVPAAKPASIIGSEESSTLLDSFTAFVSAVDGVLVAAGRQGWNHPVPLKAGPHRLTVAFNRGVFAAQADLSLTARSEAAYQLNFATDAQLFGKNSYCEFWIVDTATGETVTARPRVALTRITPGG